MTPKSTAAPFIPFVFSAASEASLKAYLTALRQYLRADETAHGLRDIADTLHRRRTCFADGTTVAASTVDELCTKIEGKLEASRTSPERIVGVRAMPQADSDIEAPKTPGLFTGQGAQWAQMGLDLVTSSPAAKGIISDLQARLDRLPLADRPTWSILQELEKDASSSRIMEAAISRPLCIAIQILQVDLLRAAGIYFTAVAGHSSGEIAAAYAANLITAHDAICIAYYRGLYSGLPQVSFFLLISANSSNSANMLTPLFFGFVGPECTERCYDGRGNLRRRCPRSP